MSDAAYAIRDVVQREKAPRDPYHYWRAALADRKPVDAPKGIIALGFYRARDGEAIAFTDEDGATVAWRSGEYPAPRHADETLDLFARVSMHPVTHEDFVSFCNEGRWPDQIAPVDVSADLPAHEAIEAELGALREQAGAWIAEIKAISTQEQANKAANFADAFAKLEKRATEQHKTDKAPFLEAGRQVDLRWKPVIERAAECKSWSKKASEAYLIAERRRLAEEENARRVAAAKAAQEVERQRREAEAAGLPPPAVEMAPLAPPPAKAIAGTTGRKLAVKSRTVHVIVDMRAVLAFIADMNETPREIASAVQMAVNKMRSAGATVPGVETKIIEEIV